MGRFSIFTRDDQIDGIAVFPWLHDQIRGLQGAVTAVIGPSRQGKSHLCNLLVDRTDVFKVDSNPAEPCTLDASGCRSMDKGEELGLIIDSPGMSHQVTDSVRKMFWALYGVSDNVIYSSKDFFDDLFISHLQELGSVSDSYEGRKPRLLLVLRDADSFEFRSKVDPVTQERRYVRVVSCSKEKSSRESSGDEEDVDMAPSEREDELTLDEYVAQHVIPKLNDLGLCSLFSDIRAFALPSLKRVASQSEARGRGDLDALLELVHEQVKRDQVSIIEDGEAMEHFVGKINAQAGKFCFVESTAFEKLSLAVAPFEDAGGDEQQKASLAEKYSWDAEALRADFRTKVEDLAKTCVSSQRLAKMLAEHRRNVQSLSAYIEDKEETAFRTLQQGLECFEEAIGTEEERTLLGERYSGDAKALKAEFDQALKTAKGSLVESERVRELVDRYTTCVKSLTENMTVNNLYAAAVRYAEAGQNEEAQAILAAKFNWDGALLRGDFGSNFGSVFVDGVPSMKAKAIFDEHRDHIWDLADRMDRKTRVQSKSSPDAVVGISSMIAGTALLGWSNKYSIGLGSLAILGGVNAICRKFSGQRAETYKLGPVLKEES